MKQKPMIPSERLSVGTVALRHLAGGAGKSGDGPIEISMRESDFQIIEVQGPRGEKMPAPATAKVTFTAQSFRELVVDDEPTGIWEFGVVAPTPSGEPARAMVFVDGDDIFFVKAFSRLA